MAGPEFDLLNIYARIGQTENRPFKFVVPVTATSFGDVLNSFILAERIAAYFKHSQATFLIRNDRPYKKNFTHLYRRPHEVTLIQPDMQMPLDQFLPELAGRKYPVDSPHWQDLIVPPQFGSGIYWWALPYGTLGLSPELSDKADQILRHQGLDPENWFVTLHYREPNYAWKRDKNVRDVDPERYNKVVDWVIYDLGGQVVRLGHPEMAPLEPREGFVDLSRLPNSEILQAHAVGRSAFLFCSPSGAIGFADAYRVPTFVADAADFWTGYDEQYILTHRLISSDGAELRNADLLRSEFNTTIGCSKAMDAGYRIEKCTEDELRAAVVFMVDKIRPMKGWRKPALSEAPADASLVWPPIPEIAPQFFDPAESRLEKVYLF